MVVVLADAVAHSETKLQKSASIPFKILKMKVLKNDRNRKLWESAETCFENFVKSHQVNLILADLGHLKTTVRRRLAWRGAAGCYTKQLGTTTKEVSQTCDLTLDG